MQEIAFLLIFGLALMDIPIISSAAVGILVLWFLGVIAGSIAKSSLR